MTDALLILVGLVELVLRIVIAAVLTVTMLGIVVLADTMDSNGKGLDEFFHPVCWRLLENR